MSEPVDVRMTAEYASKFAALALSHITREYPNKLDHVLLGVDDAKGPRAIHPIFYGSFDWHSCVHGYWLLARLHRLYPSMPEAPQIRALFNEHITNANVVVEAQYAAHPSRGGFERPYGWAWLLKLSAELQAHTSVGGETWSRTLNPLAEVFANRFKQFLPKATYPVRTGTHFNTAFAVTLALDYATAFNDVELCAALHAAALRWYRADANAPSWEPSGDDFLSSTLVEAECMRRVLPAAEFAHWFAAFLPLLLSAEPRALFTPAIVSDRTDGKIAHLDGLNFSRAWCWRALSAHFAPDDTRFTVMQATAESHLRASLPHVAGDYMGEHWLATYALLALEA
ncbi:MAG: DUF2891 domain-containing protein [Gemmatimonas sp.]